MFEKIAINYTASSFYLLFFIAKLSVICYLPHYPLYMIRATCYTEHNLLMFIHITVTVQAALIQAAEGVISPSRRNTRIKISLSHHYGRFAGQVDALHFHAKQLLRTIQKMLSCKKPTTASVYIKTLKLHKHIKSSSSSIFFLVFGKAGGNTTHVWAFSCMSLCVFLLLSSKISLVGNFHVNQGV